MTPKAMIPSSVTLLDSHYWHVRFNRYQFVQWPAGTLPKERHAFGWDVREQCIVAAKVVQGLRYGVEVGEHWEPEP